MIVALFLLLISIVQVCRSWNLLQNQIIHSAKQAGDFGRELQLLFRYLGVSEANMEKGQMRVDSIFLCLMIQKNLVQKLK